MISPFYDLTISFRRRHEHFCPLCNNTSTSESPAVWLVDKNLSMVQDMILEHWKLKRMRLPN